MVFMKAGLKRALMRPGEFYLGYQAADTLPGSRRGRRAGGKAPSPRTQTRSPAGACSHLSRHPGPAQPPGTDG